MLLSLPSLKLMGRSSASQGLPLTRNLPQGDGVHGRDDGGSCFFVSRIHDVGLDVRSGNTRNSEGLVSGHTTTASWFSREILKGRTW
jgi:hypothetical protein